MPESDSTRKLSLEVTAAAGGALAASAFHSYLLFHSILELITVSVGFTLFILAWNASRFLSGTFLGILGIGYGFSASVDLLHALAYPGMHIFAVSDPNLPTQLWVAARFLQVGTLCLAPLFLSRKTDNAVWFAGFLAATSLILALVFSGAFPDCYLPGKGVTTFRVGSELAIFALVLVATVLIYREKPHFERPVFFRILLSVLCTAASEALFAADPELKGAENLMGHLLKLAAYYQIYRALVVTGIKEPMELIFRELSLAKDELSRSREGLEEEVRERTAELRQRDLERLAHLRFFQCMDRVNRAIQGTDLERTMSDVLGVMLEIFDCDRASLTYPCDPGAPSWHAPMERTRPQYPGIHQLGITKPMDPEVAEVLTVLLSREAPAAFGEHGEYPLPAEAADRFGIRSCLALALHPKGDRPWQLAIHQCSRPRAWSAEERHLLQEIGRRLSDALTSLVTYRNLRDKQQRLAALALELSMAEERERRRIAASLHDNIGQDLALSRIKVGMLSRRELDPADSALLGELREILDRVIGGVRSLTHLISPPILEIAGLEAALKWQAMQMESDYGLKVDFEDDLSAKVVPREIASELYFAARELLINVAKHAGTDNARLTVGRREEHVVIEVEDRGAGFDPARVDEPSAGAGTGFGLFNIRRRILHLGGSLEVASTPGAGTRVTISMPLAA